MAAINKKKLLSNVKFAAVGLVVGLVLGAGGMIFLQNYNPPDPPEQVDRASIVFERIVAQNEMVSVSQRYNITDKATDTVKLFDIIEVPWVANSFWYRYVGTIKAGVNLEDATYRQEGSTIYVALGEPCVISNTPDMSESGVLEENSSIFNPIHVEDVDLFQAQCFARSESEAIEGGLLEEARMNAEGNVRAMFIAALGDEYTVEFE